jgi:hypothetical protein
MTAFDDLTPAEPDDFAYRFNAHHAQIAANKAAIVQLAEDTAGVINAMHETITVLTTAVTSLDARLDALEVIPTPPPPPEVLEAIDFAVQNAGHYPMGSIVGKGSATTTYRVKPGSSTKTPPATGTNPYRVVRAGAMSGTLLKALRVAGVTVEGYQGHNTHGLTVGFTDGAVIEDVVALGVKGSGSTPPFETFSIEVWQAINATIRDCRVDGRDVASSLFGIMTTDGLLMERCKAFDAETGFGVAIWQSGNMVFRDLDLRGNRKAMNFEQCYGTILVENADMRDRTSARTTGPDIVVATAGYTPGRGPLAGVNQPSAKVTIKEPVWDRAKGPLIVGVPTIGTNYAAAGNKPHSQRVQDVTVIIDGITYTGAQNNTVVKIGNYWNG